MKFCWKWGIKLFVYASSSSVYGDHPNLQKIEGIEGNILSPYALTKRVDEEYAKLYKKLYGLDTYGLRYFNFFGIRQNPLGAYAVVITNFLNSLLKDCTVTINGDPTKSRDFTHINNVVYANLLACAAPSSSAGTVMNIGTHGRVTLTELYTELGKLMKITPKVTYLSERPGDIAHSFASIEAANELINYKPIISFAEGLQLTIESFNNK